MPRETRAQTEERLKSPNLPALRKIKKLIDQMIDDGADVQLTDEQAVDVLDCIAWTCEHLAKRRDYHKMYQTKNKTQRRLLEEALAARGGDPEAVKRAAQNAFVDAMVDESDEEPVLPPNGRDREVD